MRTDLVLDLGEVVCVGLGDLLGGVGSGVLANNFGFVVDGGDVLEGFQTGLVGGEGEALSDEGLCGLEDVDLLRECGCGKTDRLHEEGATLDGDVGLGAKGTDKVVVVSVSNALTVGGVVVKNELRSGVAKFCARDGDDAVFVGQAEGVVKLRNGGLVDFVVEDELNEDDLTGFGEDGQGIAASEGDADLVGREGDGAVGNAPSIATVFINSRTVDVVVDVVALHTILLTIDVGEVKRNKNDDKQEGDETQNCSTNNEDVFGHFFLNRFVFFNTFLKFSLENTFFFPDSLVCFSLLLI